tara:strand:+ start:109 stop:1470 length:1362 start_codon:yes stop_codon:yes gene_type:complete
MSDFSSTSRYIEIRPDNIPADGVISFKNGFPVLSFTISAQEGLLDPSTIRIVGDLNVYSDNNTPPTKAVAGDKLNMNSRLGIFNVVDQLTIRSNRTKMICEQIRHYSKWLNTYMATTSSLQDQMGHLGESCLMMPNSDAFREGTIETPGASLWERKSFSMHLPCGMLQSGNMINLRPDAFGGLQIEIMLAPDSNVLYFEDGVIPPAKAEAHYRLSDLKLCCEVMDIPSGELTSGEGSGTYEFNTITSLYTSINSTNAQIQYSLALKNLLSVFCNFMPVSNINTLTADSMATTYPSNAKTGVAPNQTGTLAPINRVQFLKGGTKYPAEFDYVANIVGAPDTNVPDPQIVKGLYDAIAPVYNQNRSTLSTQNMNRGYVMGTLERADSYANIPEGGSVMGLGVKYGLGGAGEDFSTEQFGISVDSDLSTDNPIGVYLFFKAKATLVYSPTGIQLVQ